MIIAIVILAGKGDQLITEYNTASEEEREKIFIKRLRLVVALVLMITAAICAVTILSAERGDDNMQLGTLFSIFLVTIVGLILANTLCKRK